MRTPIKGIRRKVGTASDEKATADIVMALLMRIPDTLADKQDKALRPRLRRRLSPIRSAARISRAPWTGPALGNPDCRQRHPPCERFEGALGERVLIGARNAYLVIRASAPVAANIFATAVLISAGVLAA